MRHQVITCQLVAVSALKMCQDIKKKGTTTDGEGKPLNPMPFTAMLTNSVVWGLYGLGRRDFTSECATSPGQFKSQHNRNVEDRPVTGTVGGDTPLRQGWGRWSRMPREHYDAFRTHVLHR